VAASNPPLITFESRESQLQIRGNLKLEFAGKSPPKPKFPANPVAEIPAISIADQSLRDISRSTKNEIGAKLARPELFKLLADAHEGDILLVKQVDRLSRLTAAD
jgi:hypothetical protein